MHYKLLNNRDQGNREIEGNLIKAQYVHVWNTKVKPCELSIYTLKYEEEDKPGPVSGWVPVKKGRKGKQRGWRRVNTVDVFCTHAWKYNNEICWHCSKKERCGGGMKNDGEDESNKIYHKHVHKCQNITPYTIIKCKYKLY
jgi:hypothetical protein